VRFDPAGRLVAVGGVGVSGRAAALALARLGADVIAVDARDGAEQRATAAELSAAGVRVRLGDATVLPDRVDLVVTSPGWRPDQPLLTAALRSGVEVIGEVELAWRLRPPGAAPWLAITGTNGKTTTTRMAAAMLGAAGRRVVAAGNVGTPLVDAVLTEPAPEVVVAELSSFQLHWSVSLACAAGALLNLAQDHLDWHGSFAAYTADKLKIWAGGLALGNRDDPEVAARLADVAGRTVAVTLGRPREGELGVEDGYLVDRAFAEAALLARVEDVRPSGPHHLANALAAAGLARSRGVEADAVARGLAGLRLEPHRGDVVATVDGVAYVDDSKATNPHAATASITAHTRVVWIVGGLLKGADLTPAVRAAADRLAGAVVVGVDRGAVLEALTRHAPQVPVVEVARTDTGAMDEAVTSAARLATPGTTVLLAPAAASMDMFRDYAERGEAFVAAVVALAARRR